MELLSRDRTICGGLFAAQRVRNRRLSKPNTVVIRRAGYGALGRLDRVRGVRFLRLTRRAADGRAQPEMTRSRHDALRLGSAVPNSSGVRDQRRELAVVSCLRSEVLQERNATTAITHGCAPPCPMSWSNCRPLEPSPRPICVRNAVHAHVEPSIQRASRRARVNCTPSRGTSSS
jgi:hypothetical protein